MYKHLYSSYQEFTERIHERIDNYLAENANAALPYMKNETWVNDNGEYFSSWDIAIPTMHIKTGDVGAEMFIKKLIINLNLNKDATE